MTHFTSKLTMVALGFAMIAGNVAVSEAGGCHGGGGYGGFPRPSIYRAPQPYYTPSCHAKVIQPQLPPPAYDQSGQQYGQGQFPQGQSGQSQFPQGPSQGQFSQGQSQFPQGQSQGQFSQGQGQFPQGQSQGQFSQGQSQFPQGQSQGQFSQGQGQAPQGQGQFSQGQGQAQQGQGQAPQGQGQAPQGQGQFSQGQGQAQQGQGQAPQGQGQGQVPQNSGVAGGNPQSAPAGSQNNAAANSAEMTALELLAGMSSDQGQAQQPQASTAEAAPQAMSSQPESGRVGTWIAKLPNNASVRLDLRADGSFVWTAINNGKTSNFSGSYNMGNGSLTLIRSNDNQQLAGILTDNAGGFNFKLNSAKDSGLNFARS